MEYIEKQTNPSFQISQLQRRMEFAERVARLGYWELDLKTKKFYWSAEMFRIFGLNSKHTSIKRNFIREFILPEDLPIYKHQLTKLLHNFEPVEGQIRIRRKNGEIVSCLFKADILVGDNKKRIVGTFQDITNLVYSQIELEKAHQEAKEACLSKDYFLAQASHDLRQPLQALMLYADALLEENLPFRAFEIGNKIKLSAVHLQNLINNFLDISKLDCGGIKPDIKKFDIKVLIDRLCLEYHEYNNFGVVCKADDVSVCFDAVLLERIIRNLMSNAIKYTKGKILLTCRLYKNNIVIRIVDNGCGIKYVEQNKIFDDFYQSKDVEGNQNSGCGLGLGIVRRIVFLLNGKIKVKSVLGKYCAFEIKLPLTQMIC
ncbi:MAG: PAS domain-containing protein [Alphaproteobacteria bacterium]|nr:PAS domain-containing protein [Alphaproteobacteria bacterium]